MKEIKSLTSLRGLFALWVVSFHLLPEAPNWRMPVIDRGYLGVDFFFMLSGFILTRAHGVEFSGPYKIPTYLRFLIKRFGRLFPLHILVLIGACFMMHLEGRPQYWWPYIVSEAALIHRWGIFYSPRGAINGPDWSISTEWAVNILFPAILALTGALQRSAIRATVAAIVIVIVLFYLSRSNGSMDIGEANSVLPLVRCIVEFGAGTLLFGWLSYFDRIASDRVIALLLLAILSGIVVGQDILVVGAMAPLLPALALNRGRATAFLENRLFHGLGLISYSIYLIQLPVIQGLDHVSAGSKLAWYAHWSSPVFIIALAAVTYILVEKNGIYLTRLALRSRILKFGG